MCAILQLVSAPLNPMLFWYTNLCFHSCDIQEEIKMLKKKIYNEIVTNKKNAIHNPDSF